MLDCGRIEAPDLLLFIWFARGSEWNVGRRQIQTCLAGEGMTASVHSRALNQSLPVPAFTTDLSNWLKKNGDRNRCKRKRKSVSSPAHLCWGVCNKQRQKYWLRSEVKQAALNIGQKTGRILSLQWFSCWNAAHDWAIRRISKQHLQKQHKHRYQYKKCHQVSINQFICSDS